jgi:hypothetical protein
VTLEDADAMNSEDENVEEEEQEQTEEEGEEEEEEEEQVQASKEPGNWEDESSDEDISTKGNMAKLVASRAAVVTQDKTKKVQPKKTKANK